MGAKGLFPAVVQSVMVYHQPINALAAQCLGGLLCVGWPVGAQPSGMGCVCGHGVCGCRQTGQGHGMVSALGNHVQQMSGVWAADEAAACAPRVQGICQREATHDVACADLHRCVNAEKNAHIKQQKAVEPVHQLQPKPV